MYAVLKTGGKQYKVAANDILTVERLANAPGETVQFNEVLMLGGDAPAVGTPLVDGAAVQAEVLEQLRGPKTISFKRRRRKHSSARRKGHRQYLTKIRVTDILPEGAAESGVTAARGGLVRAEAAPAAKPAKRARPQGDAPAAEAAAPGAQRPGNLLSAPEGDADDLKKIEGLGPKAATALNEAGVFHFGQIAAWTAAELAWIDAELGLKGRAERDDWVGQAAKLAGESA